MKNIKNNFLFLCFGIVLGILLCVTFFNRTDRPYGDVPDSAAATSIDYAEQVQAMEEAFSIRQDSLVRLEDSLSQALDKTKMSLGASQKRSKALQVQIYELLDTRFERQQAADSALTPSPCDSLLESVGAYLVENAVKDSLHFEVQKSLEEQLVLKEDQLQLKSDAYNQLRSAFDSNQIQTKALELENASLLGKYKKQRAKSRILSAVLLFVTGAGATYLLQK